MKKYFITAVGTEIGKTFVLISLIRELIASGKKVEAIKPIITGFSETDKNSDSELIRQALGKEEGLGNIAKISPWRLKNPLSPDIAGRMENAKIDFNAVKEFCLLEFDKAADFLFIEGAGGVMTPVNGEKTMLDLMEDLRIPVILITGSYLGSLSHTLTAIEAIKAKDLEIKAVVVNESVSSAPNMEETKKSLSHFSAAKIVSLSRNPGKEQLADLGSILF